MLSQSPVDPDRINPSDNDKAILRIGMVAELDAISFYEQLATTTTDEKIAKVLLDIAREEKTHLGEFEAMLLKLDNEQVTELKNGQKEIEELT